MKTERQPLIPTQPRQRLAILAGVLLLGVVLWNFWLPYVEDFMAEITAPGLPANVDFFAYYTAGHRLNGLDNPYYYGDAKPGNPLLSEYIYPPTFLPFFGALARLPYNAARYVWLGLYFTAYLAAFAALILALEPGMRLAFASLGIGLTFTSFPLLFHIRNGQADMLVIGLVLLSFAGYTRGWKGLSALILALAALFKVSPAFLLIFYVLYLRDWRFLLYFTLSALGVVLLSLLVVPFHYYPEYVIYVLPVISGGTVDFLNQSALRFIAQYRPLPQIVAAGGLLLLAGYAAWAGWRTPAHQRRLSMPLGEHALKPFSVLFLNMLVILVFQGKSWSMAYVWTILPAALVLAHLLQYPRRIWVLLWAVAASFLLVSKVYGYPPLDFLNLYGALAMGALLVVFSWPGKKLIPALVPAEEAIGDISEVHDDHTG